MSESMLQAILQVIGGGLTGFLIARYTANQNKAIKNIEYKTKKIKLLQLHEDTPDSIKVTVDKSIITGDENDRGIQEPISSAVAHSVLLKNRGNSPASDVNLEVVFDEDVDILSYSSSPASSDIYEIDLKTMSGKGNILRVYLPYLNPNSTIDLSIVTTDEEINSEPSLLGAGKGIEVSKFKISASPLPVVVVFIATIFVSLALFEGAIVQGSIGTLIPDSWVRPLGGIIETVEVQVLSFPPLHKFVAIAGGFALLVGLICRLIRKNTF